MFGLSLFIVSLISEQKAAFYAHRFIFCLFRFPNLVMREIS